MNFVIVGAEEGRSRVTSVHEVFSNAGSEPDPSPESTKIGSKHDMIWSTEGSPSDISVPVEARHGEIMDLFTPYRASKWFVAAMPPNLEMPFHRTDTIDYGTLIAGEMTILLEEGEYTLKPGDTYLVQGVQHGWRSGPEGNTYSVIIFGIEPVAG
jgi:hypothetical protein